MSEEKYYITPEIAKVKIPRYQFWSIRDEQGIVIQRSDKVESRTFAEVLDQVLKDNIDYEISFKYGTSDNSARHNIALYIKVNEDMEFMPTKKSA